MILLTTVNVIIIKIIKIVANESVLLLGYNYHYKMYY